METGNFAFDHLASIALYSSLKIEADRTVLQL